MLWDIGGKVGTQPTNETNADMPLAPCHMHIHWSLNPAGHALMAWAWTPTPAMTWKGSKRGWLIDPTTDDRHACGSDSCDVCLRSAAAGNADR